MSDVVPLQLQVLLAPIVLLFANLESGELSETQTPKDNMGESL